MQPVPITTNVASSNPAHVKVFSIQHYVIKFVSDLWQVGGFLRVLRFPPTIKLTATLQLKYWRTEHRIHAEIVPDITTRNMIYTIKQIVKAFVSKCILVR